MSIKISPTQEISAGYNLFKQDWVYFIVVTIGYMILMSLFNSQVKGGQDNASQVSVAFPIISSILSTIAGIGYTDSLLRFVRGERNIPYKEFFRKLDIGLVVKLMIFNFAYMIAVVLGLIFFIFPGIYIAIRYSFVSTLMIDKGMGLRESIKESSELTKGIKFDLFIFGTLAIALFILGFMAFIVGIIAVIPIVSLAWLVIYNKLINQSK